MPKRVIDFDAMWGSDKLASCAEWAQAEYAWLYGLADASGCFELTNLRVIWGRVAAIRQNLTIERLEQIFDEFQLKGLLFVWEHEGKRYGHWSGSDVPGRLPAPSWRMRLERLAPPVPKRQFAEYMSRFARGRAALAGGGFRGESGEQFESSDLKLEIPQNKRDRGDCCSDKRGKGSESSNLKFEIPQNQQDRGFGRSGERGERADISNLKFEIPDAKQSSALESGLRAFQCDGALRRLQDGVEETQAQDWNLEEELSGKKEVDRACQCATCEQAAEQRTQNHQNLLLDSNSKAQIDSEVRGPAAEQRKQDHQNLLLNSKAQFNPAVCGRAVEQRAQHSQHFLSDSKSNAETGRGDQHAGAAPAGVNRAARTASAGATPAVSFQWRDKSDLLARELAVGRGPVCGPVKVKPEALERMRARDAARRAGSRSP